MIRKMWEGLLCKEGLSIASGKEVKEIIEDLIIPDKINPLAFSSNYEALLRGGIPSTEELLETRMGQCLHQSRAFVALLQHFGIPAKLVAGEGHGWVVAWVKPYGWLEIDPTIGYFCKDFLLLKDAYNYQVYCYDVSHEEDYQVSAYTLLIEKTKLVKEE